MEQENKIEKNRMIDLSREASRGYYTHSHFLTLAEQSDLLLWQKEGALGRYILDGGYEGAERKLAIFGDSEEFGYLPAPPTVWLKIAPIAQKFADTLTHRDLLGSLMALGIKRECLGDILLHENVGYLYVLDTVAAYLADTLTKVKHTDVAVTAVDTPPAVTLALPEESIHVVASERLDAFVAAVFRLSRSEASALCEKGLVAIDGRVTEKSAATVKEGAYVSVRGFGRFRFEKITGDTRKGKLRIAVRLFS